jgi:hypothetical protein
MGRTNIYSKITIQSEILGIELWKIIGQAKSRKNARAASLKGQVQKRDAKYSAGNAASAALRTSGRNFLPHLRGAPIT